MRIRFDLNGNILNQKKQSFYLFIFFLSFFTIIIFLIFCLRNENKKLKFSFNKKRLFFVFVYFRNFFSIKSFFHHFLVNEIFFNNFSKDLIDLENFLKEKKMDENLFNLILIYNNLEKQILDFKFKGSFLEYLFFLKKFFFFFEGFFLIIKLNKIMNIFNFKFILNDLIYFFTSSIDIFLFFSILILINDIFIFIFISLKDWDFFYLQRDPFLNISLEKFFYIFNESFSNAIKDITNIDKKNKEISKKNNEFFNKLIGLYEVDYTK